MTGYVKLFQSILGSSIWAGPDPELRVWIAILALKNRQHVVRISPPGLATIARVDLEACRRALDKFRAPDPDSTSKEFKGRKIEDLPEGGYLVLNGAKYAAMLSLEERREYQRTKQAEYRKRRKTNHDEAVSFGAQEAIKDGLAAAVPLPEGKTLCEVFAQEDGTPCPTPELRPVAAQSPGPKSPGQTPADAAGERSRPEPEDDLGPEFD